MSRAQALEHFRAGRMGAAAAILESELQRNQEDASSWFLLGACRHALHDLRGAEAAFARSVQLDGGNLEAQLAHVATLQAFGDRQAALDACKRARDRFPGNSRLEYAHALCLEDLGKTEEALARYTQALAISPDFEDALHNKGRLLARLARFEDAETCLRHYVAAFPQSIRAHGALADVLLAQGKYHEAIAALDAMEREVPRQAALHIRRGAALASMGHYSEARTVFAEARMLDATGVAEHLRHVAPNTDHETLLSPENIFLSRGWAALARCDWSGWDRLVAEMRRCTAAQEVVLEPAIAFASRLLPLSGAERHAIARQVSSFIERNAPVLPPLQPHRRPRIRVGVLSPDLREHLNAYLLRPLFELADRARFEIFAYSTSADDGSPIRSTMQSTADVFRDLHATSDRDAAGIIRQDDIDILLDVGGYTTGARFAITAQRPARVHVNYLGFSCSLASPRVDYAIVDRIVGSDDSEWTEARVYLPDTHFLYDFRTQPPAVTVTRDDYGLPQEQVVFCAFHRVEKITPDAFTLWMRILERVPNSVLWFRALPDKAHRALREQAIARGIAAARLLFAPFEPSQSPRYLDRHRLGDLMLDALHHNATTSACDALGAGLPLLTLRGYATAARNGESLVRASGLPELVARDLEDYVNSAVLLASDPAKLRHLRYRLIANRKQAPLFNTVARVRGLEAAFQGMHDRMLRGEKPSSFDV